MIYYIFLSLVSIIFSQDVFGGYVLHTPGGGGNATSYLKTDNSIVNTWSHASGPTSIPYLVAGMNLVLKTLYYTIHVKLIALHAKWWCRKS